MSVIDFSKQEIHTFPFQVENEVLDKVAVTIITAQNCRIEKLSAFAQFQNLRVLDLSSNNLSQVNLVGLHELRALVLQKNQLTRLPKDWHSPLEYLDISKNRFEVCPQLPSSLVALNLNQNLINDMTAFNYYKKSQHQSLAFLSIESNPIETNIQVQVEKLLPVCFPQLTKVITRYSSQRCRNGFKGLSNLQVYAGTIPYQNWSEEGEDDQIKSLVQKIHYQCSPDSQFGSKFKGLDTNRLQTLIDLRKRDIEKAQQHCDQLKTQSADTEWLMVSWKRFLMECNEIVKLALQVNDQDKFQKVMASFKAFSTHIDIYSEKKKEVVAQLVRTLQSPDFNQIDQQLRVMEELIKQMISV